MEKLKELDKKILKGLGITVAFLIIWLVTLPHVSYKDNPLDPYAGLNETQKYYQLASDIDNYNTASLFQDNTFCNNIMNSSMKRKCIEMNPAPAQTPVKTEPILDEKNPADVDNYNTASLFKDKTFCNNIIDEQMKTDCLKLDMVSSESTPVATTQIPQKTASPEDIDNYNTAMLFNDKTFCNNIIDEQMKTDCLSR